MSEQKQLLRLEWHKVSPPKGGASSSSSDDESEGGYDYVSEEMTPPPPKKPRTEEDLDPDYKAGADEDSPSTDSESSLKARELKKGKAATETSKPKVLAYLARHNNYVHCLQGT